ncbi:MAG: NUDIX hydrolase [Candidatus Magasanikbacteria bacterium]|jgi:mutator protein MutT|nr:NUDIX hydrolase [Candidatus Magasanikbacteria bacterium]MBT4314761.1 NUDIX hydrolase [Candidatus Magasanikbacteria bacterium]MBT4547538.1 NUDIX hydrolase [Candidatus Magasanikbacteria bacterium]MBT6819396.1 NUDIX hydrolase [Candidatus Magasanikbacteria bacterium]
MKTIIASGPVIIENGKVLLDKEQKVGHITNWLFPGGKKENDEMPEETCKREVMEELGIEIKIVKQLETIEREKDGVMWTLHHFLAERVGEIKIGDDVVEYGWFDIESLPDNCSPNVYKIIEEYKNML